MMPEDPEPDLQHLLATKASKTGRSSAASDSVTSSTAAMLASLVEVVKDLLRRKWPIFERARKVPELARLRRTRPAAMAATAF